jgi:hypothetical protein
VTCHEESWVWTRCLGDCCERLTITINHGRDIWTVWKSGLVGRGLGYMLLPTTRRVTSALRPPTVMMRGISRGSGYCLVGWFAPSPLSHSSLPHTPPSHNDLPSRFGRLCVQPTPTVWWPVCDSVWLCLRTRPSVITREVGWLWL